MDKSGLRGCARGAAQRIADLELSENGEKVRRALPFTVTLICCWIKHVL